MRTFVTQILVFLLPVALLLGGVEYAFRQVPSLYVKKWQIVNGPALKADTLVLGNSQAFYGIDPTQLDAAVNLATPSQDYGHDRQLFEYVKSRNPSLKTVVVNLSTFSSGYKMSDSPERWREGFINVYWQLDGHSGWHNLSLEVGLDKTFEAILKHQRGEDKALCSDLGQYEAESTDAKTVATAAPITVKRHANVWSPRHHKYATDTLLELAKAARENGVNLVLVALPTSPAYATAVEGEKYFAESRKLAQTLAKQDCVRWVDLQNTPLADDAFHDPDHLSKSASLTVTSRLAETLDTLPECVIR